MACVKGGRAAAQAGGGVVKVARDHLLQCKHTPRRAPSSSARLEQDDDEAAVLVQ